MRSRFVCVFLCIPSLNQNENPIRSETSVRELNLFKNLTTSSLLPPTSYLSRCIHSLEYTSRLKVCTSYFVPATFLLTVTPPTERYTSYFLLTVTGALVVKQVTDGTATAAAGLRVGDRVWTIDGEVCDFAHPLSHARPHSACTL